MKNPTYAWAIKRPDGGIGTDLYENSSTAKDYWFCSFSWREEYKSWSSAYRAGYRCVRVKLVEVKKMKITKEKQIEWLKSVCDFLIDNGNWNDGDLFDDDAMRKSVEDLIMKQENS